MDRYARPPPVYTVCKAVTVAITCSMLVASLIVSLCLPTWRLHTESYSSSNEGLWMECVLTSYGKSFKCTKTPSTCSDLPEAARRGCRLRVATRSLLIIASIGFSGCVFISLYMARWKDFNPTLVRVKLFLLTMGFFCELAAVVMGVTWSLGESRGLGPAAVIAISALVFTPIVDLVVCSYCLEDRPDLAPTLSSLSDTRSVIFVSP